MKKFLNLHSDRRFEFVNGAILFSLSEEPDATAISSFELPKGDFDKEVKLVVNFPQLKIVEGKSDAVIYVKGDPFLIDEGFNDDGKLGSVYKMALLNAGKRPAKVFELRVHKDKKTVSQGSSLGANLFEGERWDIGKPYSFTWIPALNLLIGRNLEERRQDQAAATAA